jgi:hypothetical protein
VPQTAMLRFVGDLDLSNWLVPSACLVGSDLNGRLLLRSLAPLIVIIAVPTVGGALSAVQRLRRPSSSAPDDSMRSTLASAPKDRARRPKSLGDATRRGFYKCLPVSLVLTFCFTVGCAASRAHSQDFGADLHSLSFWLTRLQSHTRHSLR